jgi:uncharacterized cupredoxin-like copper-binding protein
MRRFAIRSGTSAAVIGVLAVGLLGGGCGFESPRSGIGSPRAADTSSPGATMLASTTVEATTAPSGATKIVMMNISFIPNNIKLKAGTIVIFLVNRELGAFHNLGLRDPLGQLIVVSDNLRPGQSAVFTIVHLGPGKYKMVCTVETHEAAGMVGTWTVT